MTLAPNIPQLILGIDPGLHGALALFNIQTHQIQVFDMPIKGGQVDGAMLAAIVDTCKCWGPIVGVVEQVGSRQRQAHAFSFGLATGIVHGVLSALSVPFSLLQPAQWKGAVGLRRLTDEAQRQNKARARELASKLWPAQADLFKRVKDADRAEACLIARHFASKNGWI